MKATVGAQSKGPNPTEICPDGSIKIELTRGYYAYIDAADYCKVMGYRWRTRIPPARHTCYAIANSKPVHGRRTVIQMHHLILPLKHGLEVDHIDRNGLNNRGSNLRLVTHRENLAHGYRQWQGAGFTGRPRKDNKTGVPGVSWDNTNTIWDAIICVNRHNIHVYRGKCFKRAVEARRAAEQQYLKAQKW